MPVSGRRGERGEEQYSKISGSQEGFFPVFRRLLEIGYEITRKSSWKREKNESEVHVNLVLGVDRENCNKVAMVTT